MSTFFLDACGAAMFSDGSWSYSRDARNITVYFSGHVGWTAPVVHRAVIDDFGNLVNIEERG